MQILKRPSLLFLALVVPSSAAHAGEGMWLPEQLDAVGPDMAALGLELDPAQLGDLAQHPLGAIISLGGCSASFVSADGLVITNHHCAEGALALNSTPDQDLVTDGFHAGSRQGEIWAGPGSRVYVTESLTDVTDQVRAAIAGASTDRERFDAVDRVKKELVEACESQPSRHCEVASYFNGQQWRLIQQLEIEDVRLVFAPPSMVGFYGGDIDNWMWPRHCGDFAFFRAYVAPDGAPAAYSDQNVPYRPAHHLTVAFDGVDEGDFVMVAGYPGSTSRYRTGAEVTHAATWSYPWQIEVMRELIAIIDARSAEDEDARVRLSSSRFGLSNYLKNNEGMLDGLVAGGAAQRAVDRDAQLRSQLASGDATTAEYLEAIDALDALVARANVAEQRDALLGWMNWSVDLLGVAMRTYRLSIERAKDDDLDREAGYQERDWEDIAEGVARVERSYDAVADERMLAFWITQSQALPDDLRIEALDALVAEYADEADPAAAAARAIYAETGLTDSEARLGWLDQERRAFERSDDPLIALAVALYPLNEAIREEGKELWGAGYLLRPAYMSALRELLPGELYPDANSTLRVTFGLVRGYDGPDGVFFRPFTTLAGVAAKHTGEEPFDAPDALLAAIASAGPSRYDSAALGTVPVNFLSDLDTTGGNSGSATLNARGELVGLLFDGNYESMASDWVFDTEQSRSIHVDIRYVVWGLDHVWGAHDVLAELGIAAESAAD